MATGGISNLVLMGKITWHSGEVLLDRLPFTSTDLTALQKKVAALCIVNP